MTDERDAFTGHLDGVGVLAVMARSAADRRLRELSAEVSAAGRGRPR